MFWGHKDAFLKYAWNTNTNKEMHCQQGRNAKNILSPIFSLKLLSLEITVPTLH